MVSVSPWRGLIDIMIQNAINYNGFGEFMTGLMDVMTQDVSNCNGFGEPMEILWIPLASNVQQASTAQQASIKWYEIKSNQSHQIKSIQLNQLKSINKSIN